MVDSPEVPNSSESISSLGELTTWTKLLCLVKENQLLTAAVLFAAWQAGLFLQAATAVQGVCA